MERRAVVVTIRLSSAEMNPATLVISTLPMPRCRAESVAGFPAVARSRGSASHQRYWPSCCYHVFLEHWLPTVILRSEANKLGWDERHVA